MLVLRNELQQVIERLAQSDMRALTPGAPATGFVQPDHVKLTVPVAFGIDAGGAVKSDMRLKIEAYHEGNPPPSGVVLGSIEVQFVIASKR